MPTVNEVTMAAKLQLAWAIQMAAHAKRFRDLGHDDLADSLTTLSQDIVSVGDVLEDRKPLIPIEEVAKTYRVPVPEPAS